MGVLQEVAASDGQASAEATGNYAFGGHVLLAETHPRLERHRDYNVTLEGRDGFMFSVRPPLPPKVLILYNPNGVSSPGLRFG